MGPRNGAGDRAGPGSSLGGLPVINVRWQFIGDMTARVDRWRVHIICKRGGGPARWSRQSEAGKVRGGCCLGGGGGCGLAGFIAYYGAQSN